MRFVKGMIIGGVATVGAMIMYNEMSSKSRRQMMRKGKQFAKKIGIM